MNEDTLRPPLPPYATHAGIQFVRGVLPPPEIAEETIAQIGAALSFLLPQGDFSVTSSGRFVLHQENTPSPWQQVGLQEGVSRDPR